MSDTPESVQSLCDMVADATGAPPYTKKMVLIECLPVLKRYAELLERSAGVWVPVTERLPKDDTRLFILLEGNGGYRKGQGSYYADMNEWRDNGLLWLVTHWLDVRLPGEQQ